MDFAECKRHLSDPREVLTSLGLMEGAVRNGPRGYLVHCPTGHGRGGTPSCSVREGPDGTIQVRCFACELSGSVVDLVAACHSMRPTSPECLSELVSMCGGTLGATELPKRVTGTNEARQSVPERTYLPEVDALWSSFADIREDGDCVDYLMQRGLSAVHAGQHDLLRRYTGSHPWARLRVGEEVLSWEQSGHHMVTRVYDARGSPRGLRAWCIRQSDRKRTPASGYLASGLVLANAAGVRVLQERLLTRVIVTEGEPDWLAACERWDAPVLGVYSGSWTEEFASRIAPGSQVVVMTDRDPAGDKYAESIRISLAGKCRVRRM